MFSYHIYKYSYREEILKIAIVGAGAMGSLFASYLSKNNEVFLIDHKKEKVEKINREGIKVTESDGSTSQYKVDAFMYDDKLSSPDILFNFVKTFKNRQALENISSIIGEDTILVSLQNGYGNDKDLEKFQYKSHIVIGSTTHGSTLLSDGEIFHAGSGMTYLGENSSNKKSLEMVEKVLEKAGFDIKISQDIDKLVIEKLFINIGINAITALADKENSCIYKNKYARDMSKLLVYEACQIFNLYGYNFDKDEIFAKVLATAEKTGKNTSSMRADLLRGNKSEIDKINQIIVEKAKAKNQKSPYNEAISLLIKAKEGEK